MPKINLIQPYFSALNLNELRIIMMAHITPEKEKVKKEKNCGCTFNFKSKTK